MTSTPTEFAFVLVASMLIAQAFAVGCLWLFIEFIRAPEHLDDWYEDEEEPAPTLLEKLAATRARLDAVCTDCPGTVDEVKHQACKCERDYDEDLTDVYYNPKKPN